MGTEKQCNATGWQSWEMQCQYLARTGVDVVELAQCTHGMPWRQSNCEHGCTKWQLMECQHGTACSVMTQYGCSTPLPKLHLFQIPWPSWLPHGPFTSWLSWSTSWPSWQKPCAWPCWNWPLAWPFPWAPLWPWSWSPWLQPPTPALGHTSRWPHGPGQVALGFCMATFMDGMAAHRRLGFAIGQLGCLEQWLQLQTLEMAKIIGQALECHIRLHTWNAMLAKKCNATIWLTLSKSLGKKMQCHKGQLVGYDTNGGEYKGA